MPLPIILDTDIGTDIDDAYALVLAASSPELDLLAVTTVNSDTLLRAQIAKELLRRVGRDDVPVTVGAVDALTPGVDRGWGGHEGADIDLSGIDPDSDFDSRHAPELIAELASRAHRDGNPCTLITIGALTNAALALREFPAETRLVRRIVAMASNFNGYGEENARGEHNVACDPLAFQEVLDSGIPLILAGLNVTRRTSMSRLDVDRLEKIGGPLAGAPAGMHKVWFNYIGKDHSPMHDGLAVAAAFDYSMLTCAPVSGQVLDNAAERGTVGYNPPGAGQVTRTWVALDANIGAFHRMFFERIEQAVRSRNNRP